MYCPTRKYPTTNSDRHLVGAALARGERSRTIGDFAVIMIKSAAETDLSLFSVAVTDSRDVGISDLLLSFGRDYWGGLIDPHNYV